MPSPFPGMNPYLEQEDAWQDFHDRFIPAISDALSPQVSPHFIVKIEEHLYVHEPSAKKRLRVGDGDVSVVRSKGKKKRTSGNVATLEAPQRLVIPVTYEIEKGTFLEIRDRSNRELVCVIEVLSPTNKKPGPDRNQYLAKRYKLVRSNAHFVEIDLLRGWPRMPCENMPACAYAVLVSVAEERPVAGFWCVGLRDRLPVIPVPLREPLTAARLDLQEVLHTVYDRAYYKDYIYQDRPVPPLSPEDKAWAAAILKSAAGD